MSAQTDSDPTSWRDAAIKQLHVDAMKWLNNAEQTKSAGDYRKFQSAAEMLVFIALKSDNLYEDAGAPSNDSLQEVSRYLNSMLNSEYGTKE